MRRSNLTIAILIFCGLGCQQSAQQQRVYVDFQAVLASYKASPLPSRPVPKPPAALPAKTVAIPAVEPRTVVVEGTSESKAAAILEENRKKAVKELTALLSARYTREAERAGERRIHELDPKRAAAYASAQKAVTAEFDAYAQKRAPLIADLTSIVGFPDPNPNSLPPPASAPPFAVKRLQHAADVRQQINTLDANYENRILDLLSQAGKQYGVDLAAIEKQIAIDRAEAMRKAESEAVNEAATTYKSLRPILLGPTQVDLPGEPAQSAELPAVPAPMSAPDVRERTLTSGQREAILKSQLDMWIKLNGYQLVSDPQDGKDMTAEFVKWRQERKL